MPPKSWAYFFIPSIISSSEGTRGFPSGNADITPYSCSSPTIRPGIYCSCQRRPFKFYRLKPQNKNPRNKSGAALIGRLFVYCQQAPVRCLLSRHQLCCLSRLQAAENPYPGRGKMVLFLPSFCHRVSAGGVSLFSAFSGLRWSASIFIMLYLHKIRQLSAV